MLRSLVTATARQRDAAHFTRQLPNWERLITSSTASCSTPRQGDAETASGDHADDKKEWWNDLNASQIADKVEEMAKTQRSASLRAQFAMFSRSETSDEFLRAVDVRTRAFKLGMHLCKGQEQPISAQEPVKAALRLGSSDAVLACLLNFTPLGFKSDAASMTALLRAAASDAAACVHAVPAILRVYAAHGLALTPRTCDLLTSMCLDAEQPAAAAALAAAFEAEGITLGDAVRERVAAAAPAAAEPAAETVEATA